MKDFHVSPPVPARNEVEAWSVKRLPFEPQGSAVSFRNDLRHALRQLEPGTVCRATYTSPDHGRVDLENVLTYNLGTTQPFDRLGIERLILERSFSPVPECPEQLTMRPRHHQRYRVGDGSTAEPSATWQTGHVLVTWEGMAVPQETTTSSWAAFRHVAVRAAEAAGDITNYAVCIRFPRGSFHSLVAAVKPLVDGIVAGCGVHNGPDRPHVNAALATSLGMSAEAVALDLADDRLAVLGGVDLVRWRADRPHWNPKDDPLVLLDVGLHDGAQTSISGRVVAMERTPAPNEAARRILLMVAELHQRGYQRLHIAPGISPSGMYWRCSIPPASAFQPSHGALLRDDVEYSALAHYTSADEVLPFMWSDAAEAAASELATLFIARFPIVAAAGEGADSEYASWYRAMLSLTEPDGLPYAYADWAMPGDALAVFGCQRGVTVPLPRA